MKKCNNPSCGHEIPDESVFCMYCGTKWVPLKQKCPRCDFDDIPDNALFCPNCGLKLGEVSDDLNPGSGSHPQAVDLGLPSGTKWANMNVGATKPEEYGGYYAWGETEEKDDYSWSTYKHCNGSEKTCHNIGSDIAGTQYDVAHVQWGGNWQMPSRKQFQELFDNCESELTTLNGVKGMKFTSKINGNSIFLPAAGYRWNDGLDNAGSYGDYWSSTQGPSDSYYAYGLYFNSGDAGWSNYSNRSGGHTVRPVSRI